ncbi:MAG: DUF6063 family protein [Bdellovibrionota bacterium]
MIPQPLNSSMSYFDAAFKLFLFLLRNGKVTIDDKEMMRAWRTPEIKDIIYEVILENAEVRIFEADGVIYMLPELQSELFSYDNEFIRKSMNLKNNTELYLAYFIILCLITLFYNSDSGSSGRQYIPINDLERFITVQAEEILIEEVEITNHKEEETGLKLYRIAAHWQGLDPFNPDIKQMRRASKNRVSYILRVCRFFESEGYLQIKEGIMDVLEDSEVRILPRLKHAIENEFFHSQRKDNILKMMKNSLTKNKD